MRKFYIKETGKYGKGVFAKSKIKKGEIIYILNGKRFDVIDFAKKILSGKEYIDDPFQIGLRTYLDLNEISRTFNHSCDPSAGIRKNSELFALRDIQKGEQLTYDYSLTIAPTEWKMRCKCGSKKCRKILGDIRTVPKSRIREYWEMGALQHYMKKILKTLEKGDYKMPRYEEKLVQALGNKAYNLQK